MSTSALVVAALSIAAHALLRARARRRMEALPAGMFAGLGAEIAALAAVPLLPVRRTGPRTGRRAAEETPGLRLAA